MSIDSLRDQPSQGSIIGIDASRSVSAQPTGTELYSRYLIEALLDRAPDRFSFRLYFNQAPQSEIRNQKSEIKIIPFPRLWTHLRLSTEMIAHRPDLLFVPAHVLPIIHPRRSVVTVHDLGYLYFPGSTSAPAALVSRSIDALAYPHRGASAGGFSRDQARSHQPVSRRSR